MMSLINEFYKEDKNVKELDEIASEYLSSFVRDFPKNDIKNITLDDFLFASKGTGHDNSFCSRIFNNSIASLGNSFPSIYGIYLKEGTQLEISSTFQKKYGNDYELVFRKIKEEISSLIKSVENNDYEKVKECSLNNTFKYMLLAIYFPDRFIPAPTKPALDSYCKVINIDFDSKEEMVYRNMSLVDWKNNTDEISHWSNFMLMRFFVFLSKKKKFIDGKSYTRKSIVSKVIAVQQEIDNLHLEGKSKEAIVKLRVNQGIFRDRLLKKYSKCCLCGINNPHLLVASHIKPWVISSPEEKLDYDNGFLMCSNHDKLFDQGYITFDDSGNIMISTQLDKTNRIFSNVDEKMKIKVSDKNKKYLDYHRRNIFKK